MKKILLVEDMEMYYRKINEVFCGKVEIIWANNLAQGLDLFKENSNVDLIIMDACVPGDHPNSMPLIKDILNTGYEKPIIAYSSMYNSNLIEAGATHGADKDKTGKLALELLGIQLECKS